jgi:hypothetical protein
MSKNKFNKNYPELNNLAIHLTNEIFYAINDDVKDINSAMPYKTQYVLEEIIKLLQERV